VGEDESSRTEWEIKAMRWRERFVSVAVIVWSVVWGCLLVLVAVYWASLQRWDGAGTDARSRCEAASLSLAKWISDNPRQEIRAGRWRTEAKSNRLFLVPDDGSKEAPIISDEHPDWVEVRDLRPYLNESAVPVWATLRVEDCQLRHRNFYLDERVWMLLLLCLLPASVVLAALLVLRRVMRKSMYSDSASPNG
jgi:hypothetical protein